jgi:peptidyl-prolyl cis-trans isomerase A (cyclophilin A)
MVLGSVLLPACKVSKPEYVMKTEAGNIRFKIYVKEAPVTAANFIKYIEEQRLDGGHFYRVVRLDNQPDNAVKIEVIQGGLDSTQNKRSLPPILHETTQQTGILHKDGTISMARNNPGSASSEFFICINDQPALDFGGKRNPDGQGFAAFGQVTRGMKVVRKIQAGEASKQALTNPVKIHSIAKIR